MMSILRVDRGMNQQHHSSMWHWQKGDMRKVNRLSNPYGLFTKCLVKWGQHKYGIQNLEIRAQCTNTFVVPTLCRGEMEKWWILYEQCLDNERAAHKQIQTVMSTHGRNLCDLCNDSKCVLEHNIIICFLCRFVGPSDVCARLSFPKSRNQHSEFRNPTSLSLSLSACLPLLRALSLATRHYVQ